MKREHKDLTNAREVGLVSLNQVRKFVKQLQVVCIGSVAELEQFAGREIKVRCDSTSPCFGFGTEL